MADLKPETGFKRASGSLKIGALSEFFIILVIFIINALKGWVPGSSTSVNDSRDLSQRGQERERHNGGSAHDPQGEQT